MTGIPARKELGRVGLDPANDKLERADLIFIGMNLALFGRQSTGRHISGRRAADDVLTLDLAHPD